MLHTAAYSDAMRVKDLAACRALLRGGSKSFYAASYFLPRRVREPATALYAFCRIADDIVDLGGGGDAALDGLRRRLEDAYAGRPHPHAADRAFADVIERFAIPRVLPEALIEGFAWDNAHRVYETLDELLDYGARVAGTVGGMMCWLMGRRDAATLARACDLGIAMQLTNIVRDIGEDARAGRLYLPRAMLRERGVDPQRWLAAPSHEPAIAEVARELLAVADDFYARADSGIGRLPPDCRPGITAARLLYAEIGREVERRALDSVSRRAVVPGARKAQLLAAALRSLTQTAPWEHREPTAATRFLISCAGDMPAVSPLLPGSIAWWDVRGRMLFVLQLFDRLERRSRALDGVVHARASLAVSNAP